MKILLSLLLVLTVSLTLSAQQYRLPIGSNLLQGGVLVDNISISDWDTGWWVSAPSFTYDGDASLLDTTIASQLQKLVDNFVPPTGSEQDLYYLSVDVKRNGAIVANTNPSFRLQQSGSRWIVPPEVLDVKLIYGNTGVNIGGVLVIGLGAEIASGTIHYSTADNNRYADAPCFFGNQDDYRQAGIVYIQREYSVPRYQQEIGLKSGRLTLRMADGYAIFNLLDGYDVEVSSPAPKALEQFKIIPVVSTPRISSIVRTNNITEISVEGNSSISVALEFSENLRDWQSDNSAWIKLSSSSQTILRHTSNISSGFYRLRLSDGVQ